jgi:iron complex transport system substrate-binding protein
MRIVTLLPSATEIVCAIGLADSIVAVSHECDYPPEMRSRPRIVRAAVDARLPSAGIHAAVVGALARGGALYTVDPRGLAAARPDLVITQDLCAVCALPGAQLEDALAALPHRPEVLRLHPHSLADILQDILRVGAATGREAAARTVTERLRARLDRVRAAVEARPRPRVVCLEWLDPPFCAGHWMPEAVHLAGGREVLGVPERPSSQVDPGAVAAADPDVLVLVLCGFGVERSMREFAGAAGRPEWRTLRAVRAGRGYATDAASYFSRSGPRIVDGVEILAALLHPEAAPAAPPPGSWAALAPHQVSEVPEVRDHAARSI